MAGGPFRVGGSLRAVGSGKGHASFLNVAFIYAGNDLLSHTLSRAVQSAAGASVRPLRSVTARAPKAQA
jgi:hypothetical protein